MTADQQALVKLASESIAAAKLLARERYDRIAVSRAYYAMFYCAEAMLLEKALAFSKHSRVIAAFGKEFAKADESLAPFHRYLIDAFRARGASDYDTSTSVEVTDCSEQIARAEDFLRAATARLEATG